MVAILVEYLFLVYCFTHVAANELGVTNFQTAKSLPTYNDEKDVLRDAFLRFRAHNKHNLIFDDVLKLVKEKSIVKGTSHLENVHKIITQQLYLTPEFKQKEYLKKIKASFTEQMKKYNDKYKNVTVESDVLKNQILYDIVDASYDLLKRMSFKHLNDVVAGTKFSEYDLQLVTMSLEKVLSLKKKEDLNYICIIRDRGACKSYPDYGDHLAAFLVEILKLNDLKFEWFSMTFARLVRAKSKYLTKLIGANEWQIMESLLDIRKSFNPLRVREWFTITRAFIAQRLKLVLTKDKKVARRTMAGRILLDIIGRVFDEDGEEYLSMKFETVMTGFKEWAAGFRNDLETILNTFLMASLKPCNYAWGEDSRKEIQTLIEILFNGTSSNKRLMRDLFVKGSVFVRDHANIIL